MQYPYFDYFTVLLYLFVGTLCMLSMKLARGGMIYDRLASLKGFTALFLILLLFAGLRKVGLHLGGEDALRYQEGFLHYYNHGSERYDDTDVLFGCFTGLIRAFTDSPVIYRFFCYGLISFGYVYFIKTFSPQGISCIPFICILIPFMRSFGSMRNTMSIALFLFCIVALFHKRYFLCIIFAISSMLMHRLTFVMLSFFPFYYLFEKYIIHKSKKTILLVVLGLMLLSYLAAVQLQKYIILFSLFDNNGNADMWYLTNKAGGNILLNWPMYIVHLMLFIALMIRYKSIPNTPQITFLKIIFFFDIIILPASLVLNLWRFAEYFYIANLILWGIIITVICKKFTKESSLIVRGCALLGFYGLLYIRLTHEWEELALMPYLFIWS